MSVNRLADYLDHMEQAATDASSFVEGLSKEEFLVDKRTQQAVIMSLIIIGEAATKGDGSASRVRERTPRSALAQHARDAQPHRSWVLRH